MKHSQPIVEIPIEVDVAKVKSLIDRNADLLLIDCREPQEHAICLISGAMLLPMNQTLNRIDELESWRDGQIVVYCHAGMRSLQVASCLRSQGFPNAQSMSGGIDAWSTEIDPAVPRY